MSKKRHNIICFCIALATLTTCLCLQHLAVRYLEAGNASFVSENPTFITLGRLERTASLQGDVVILGSSVTERMRSTDHISVIGVPGCPFTVGLSLIGPDQFPPGTCFVVEGYNILSPDGQEMMPYLDNWRFNIARRYGVFSYVTQPSSLLLTGIYHARSDMGALREEASFIDAPEITPSDVSGANLEDVAEPELFEEAVATIKGLRAKGYRVCIAYYPERSGTYETRIAQAKAVAKECDVPLLDYSGPEYENKMEFTDKVHMRSTSPATARFRNTVARDARKWAK